MISAYRLDYTTKEGRFLKKEFYEEFNKVIENEDVIYNLASKEFSSNVKHHNIVDFEFYVGSKQVSATSKKLRGAMINYIRVHGEDKFKEFNEFEFVYNSELSSMNKFVYTKPID